MPELSAGGDPAVLKYRSEQEKKNGCGAAVPSDEAAEAFWKEEIEKQGREGWYGRALQYWDAQEASVDGVLGGFGHTTGQDLRESGRLLKLLRGRKTKLKLFID